VLIDNITRTFGDDVVFLLTCAVPVLLVYVGLRWWRLHGRRQSPLLVALVEAFALGYAVCLAGVTLIPEGSRGDYPPIVAWAPFTSDLGYPADRTEVLGNLVLYAPLVCTVVLLARPHRPMRFGVLVAWALPALVEIVQYLAVPGRVAAVQDCLVGAAGGVVGAALAAVLPRLPAFRTFRRATTPSLQRSGATSGP
jgi:hypothetical protein